MAAPAQISFERPFKYVFQDPNWTKKILMGGLVTLSCMVFVGIFVLAGYSKRLFLTLIKDENALIPDIDFGADLSEGLGVVAVGFCWGLGLMVLCLIPILGWMVGIAASIFMPAVMMRYFVTGRFGAAFEFKEIIEFIKPNMTNLLLVFAIGMLAGIVAQMGVIACFVGVLFTGFWSLIARTVAMADVWRLSEQAGAVPVQSVGAPPAP